MIALERPTPNARRYPDWQKRTLDLVLTLPSFLLLLPLGLLLAVLVKAGSPGPALFRQQRVGRDGRLFWLYKFRSMRAGSGGLSVTAGDDNRVTPLGKLLRKWKLDELPQLLNVLRGEMSLVGPRPEVPEYVAAYTDEQRGVLAANPGVTGLSQLEFRNEEALLAGRDDVRGFYLAEVMPRKLEIDLRYLRDRSLRLDLLIILRTIAVIIRR